ncbi:hypothetical protein B0T20DRAFT_476519 [Sordaria brevicollis]|uniref:Uncharacterized protein n=1 Tax=Sordaria brevicollis TaxID=83679 RepID=A0AAE0UFS1_SORBR|nr:hypothetical protein B0T20DRAFT_476519 [Sordaria brevicollis]
MDSSSTTPTPFPTLQVQQHQHEQTSSTTDLKNTTSSPSPPKPPPSPYGNLHWTQYLLRLFTLLTSAALLVLTVLIAAKWGKEHMEKIYAVIMAGAIISILTDLGTVYFLFVGVSQPSTPVAIAVLDAIALVMCAVGIPSVMGSEFRTEFDRPVWVVAVVVIIERVASMGTCLWTWLFIRKRRGDGMRPVILKQHMMQEMGMEMGMGMGMGHGMGATSESALAARRRGKEPATAFQPQPQPQAQAQGVEMTGTGAGAGAGAGATSAAHGGQQEYLHPESARTSSVGGGRPSLVLAGDMSGRASFPSIIVDGEQGQGDGRV